MVSIIQAIILGIVQGITEWLPISSSGHLVLFQRLFGLEPPVLFDVILHIGSLIVILIALTPAQEPAQILSTHREQEATSHAIPGIYVRFLLPG